MKKLPQISEAEYEVMKIVWKYAPINTNEITEKLTRTTSWSPKNNPNSDQTPYDKRSSFQKHEIFV